MKHSGYKTWTSNCFNIQNLRTLPTQCQLFMSAYDCQDVK